VKISRSGKRSAGRHGGHPNEVVPAFFALLAAVWSDLKFLVREARGHPRDAKVVLRPVLQLALGAALALNGARAVERVSLGNRSEREGAAWGERIISPDGSDRCKRSREDETESDA
jgi:hypothetical protein